MYARILLVIHFVRFSQEYPCRGILLIACMLLRIGVYFHSMNVPFVQAKTIGDTEGEIAKLSPSAEGYDFDGKVKFEVKVVTPGATDLNTTTHADDYEIDFNIIENIYQKSIDLFELKQRYNNKREKMELLKWRDKRLN